jgi:hypothetical protein
MPPVMKVCAANAIRDGVALLLASTLYGCGLDCTPSADIQVTVVPSSAVEPGLIANLHLVLSIDGAPARTLDIAPPHPLTGPSSLVLRPDPAPAPKYSVSLTVEALDANGRLVEIGGAFGDAVSSGCNRLVARLAPIDSGPSDGGPPVTSGDLTCAGTLDEDGDGRPNDCDLCPADYDPIPTDADADGLPDKCDPDPTRATNRLVYFEPFDADVGHWSGMVQIAGSYLDLFVQGQMISMNGIDKLPANVRAQTFLLSPGIVSGAPEASMGIYVGSNPRFDQSTGMLCTLNATQMGTGRLDLNFVQNGMAQLPTSQQAVFSNGTLFRLRLVQNGVNYSCEAVANGLPTVTVTAVAPSPAPSGPQYVGLFGANLEVRFNSVVAETVLPE